LWIRTGVGGLALICSRGCDRDEIEARLHGVRLQPDAYCPPSTWARDVAERKAERKAPAGVPRRDFTTTERGQAE
jgi:hypothetical protein